MSRLMKVQISGKDSTISNNKVVFYIDQKIKENVDFFLKDLEKEVKTLPKSQKKAWKKITLITYQACLSVLAFVKPVAAATVNQGIVSADLLQILMQLEILVIILGVALAKITFVGAGIYRILRKEKISKEWSIDIIKGLVQVLIAPIVITTITYIIYFLFGDSKWFINPLSIYSKENIPSLLPR